MLTLEVAIDLKWQATGRGNKGRLIALRDDEVLYSDEISLAKAEDQNRFIDALIGKCPGLDRDAVYEKLLELVGQDQQIRHRPEPEVSGGTFESMYEAIDGRLYKLAPLKDGTSTKIPLSNFDARIVREVVRDDGVEQSRRLVIEGTLGTGKRLETIEVATEEFARMEWVITKWGTPAVVHAGPGNKDHLRAAIQLRSGEVREQIVYGHTGWRQVGGTWAYLHAGGAIGPDEDSSAADVELDSSLANYRLETAQSQEDLVRSVRASLALLDGLAPDKVAFPLLATVYRAVLPNGTFSTFIEGRTGSLKTELAALCQQHYGAAFTASNLPANWSSTENALEGLAFLAKDALLVIDDFAPSGSRADVDRMHRTAERVFRSQGNHSGRQRMRQDGSQRPVKPPRGIILSTGEEVPKGHSIRARLLIINVDRGDVDTARLTECQDEARSGVYSRAMDGYVRWLASRYEDVVARIGTEVEQVRKDISSQTNGKTHRRTPTMMADLLAGFGQFLRYATEIGAVDRHEAEALNERCWAALLDLADEQVAQQEAADPCDAYLSFLRSGLTKGAFHLTDCDGNCPISHPDAFGWKRHGTSSQPQEWQPQGRRIGWYIDGDVFLNPEAAYVEAQSFALKAAETIGLTRFTLQRRLKERNLLASTDESRGKIVVRKVIAGRRELVLHFSGAHFIDPDERASTEPEDDLALAI